MLSVAFYFIYLFPQISLNSDIDTYKFSFFHFFSFCVSAPDYLFLRIHAKQHRHQQRGLKVDLRGCELANQRKNTHRPNEEGLKESVAKNGENNGELDDQILVKPTSEINTFTLDQPVIEEVITDETLVTEIIGEIATLVPVFDTESTDSENSDSENSDSENSDFKNSDSENTDSKNSDSKTLEQTEKPDVFLVDIEESLKDSDLETPGFSLSKFFMDLQQKQNYAIILAIACSVFAFTFAICFCMVCYCLACKNRQRNKSEADGSILHHPHPSLKSYDPEATMRYNTLNNRINGGGISPIGSHVPGQLSPLSSPLSNPLLNMSQIPDEHGSQLFVPTRWFS